MSYNQRPINHNTPMHPCKVSPQPNHDRKIDNHCSGSYIGRSLFPPIITPKMYSAEHTTPSNEVQS